MLPWLAITLLPWLASLQESLRTTLGRPYGMLRLLQAHLLADLAAVLFLSALGSSIRHETHGMEEYDMFAQIVALVLPPGLALARLPLLVCMERSCRKTIRRSEERPQPAARASRRLLRAKEYRKLQWSSAAFATACSLGVAWSLTMPPCAAPGLDPVPCGC